METLKLSSPINPSRRIPKQRLTPAEILDSKQNISSKALLRLFRERYAVIKRCLTLEIGIDQQLLNDGWPEKQVRKVLRNHVLTTTYLRHTAREGSFRFNLKGEKVEPVSKSARKWAQVRLDHRTKKIPTE